MRRSPEDLNAKIPDILGALIRHGGFAEIRQNKQRIPATPQRYSAALGILQWQVLDGYKVAPAPCSIVLQGYNALFRMELPTAFQQGPMLTTPVPTVLHRSVDRVHRRFRVNEGFLLTTSSVCRLQDISYGGLSIYADTSEQGRVGDIVSGDVCLSNGASFSVRAEVTDYSTVNDQRLCHLRLCDRSWHWSRLVNDFLHPRTRSGSAYCREVWNLYSDCGYFHLSNKSPDDFERLQSAFEEVQSHIEKAPEIGCQVVWPNASEVGGVNAALSILRIYKHAWLGYQMARKSGETSDGISGRRVLREIHLRAYEHAQQDPNIRWIIAYPQVKPVWSRMLHHDLPARYVESGQACIVRFRALEFNVRRIPCTDKSAEVQRATKAETETLAEHIARTHSPVYCDALDLVADRMDLAHAKGFYGQHGLKRDRAIFALGEDGRMVAAALVELASEGLHVFGLLDLMRLYILVPGSEERVLPLLAKGAQWFQTRGRQRYCLFLEDGQSLPAMAQEAALDMGLADMSILSTERLPDFLEYLHEITAPRPAQLEVSEARPQ